MYTHTNTHARTHTCTHTHSLTHTYTHTQSCTYTIMHAFAQNTIVYIYIRTTHTNTHTHLSIHTHIRNKSGTHTQTRTKHTHVQACRAFRAREAVGSFHAATPVLITTSTTSRAYQHDGEAGWGVQQGEQLCWGGWPVVLSPHCLGGGGAMVAKHSELNNNILLSRMQLRCQICLGMN